MIKTKIPLIVFTILLIILFPFSVFFMKSDLISSIVPGWNTTINSFWLFATILKFAILSIVVLMYWKLNKIVKEIKVKFFILHLALTVPSILNSKIPLQSFIEFNSNEMEKTISDLKTVNLIVMALNVLFLLGQIAFGVYYVRKWNNRKVNE